MASIKDVANKAGVSIGVVSRAFNNYSDINDKTRQRIIKVAKELNYTPNIVAKNLSSKKQKTIGLIASGIFTRDAKDTISYDIFRGVYTAAEENEYELSIFFIDPLKQKEQNYVNFCRERNIGGAILQGIRTDDRFFQELIDTKIPCVMVDVTKEVGNRLIGSVSSDNFGASKEIALHLLERNHRDIAIMAATRETDVNTERMKGTLAAFHEYGLILAEEDVLYADFQEDKAYVEAKDYLKKKRPTAFICFSDLMAFGVMKAVEEEGLGVPEDVSVTGFDGLIISDYTQPRLTTVQQDFFEIGRHSALLLQQLMENKLDKRHITIDHELMERESVKALTE